jgi:tetratricopeptide (TPR) repeat protein
LNLLSRSTGARARIRRTTLARPFASGSIVATAALTGVLVGAIVWSRPPFYLREFERGMACQQAADYEEATTCFTRSLQAQPDFSNALYQRARTEMLSGSYAAAVQSFTRLSTDCNDVRGVAYAGYCFNLTQEHAAAIERYEHALGLGYESVGLHNNLAVSYEIGRANIDDRERLAVAEQHLQKALELAPRSLAVRRNLVRLALRRSTKDATYRPSSVVEHVEFLSRARPDDALVSTYAAYIYGSLSTDSDKNAEKCLDAIRKAFRYGGGPTETDLKLNPAFRPLTARPEFAQLCDEAMHVVRIRKIIPEATFVDPVEFSDDTAVRHE